MDKPAKLAIATNGVAKSVVKKGPPRRRRRRLQESAVLEKTIAFYEILRELKPRQRLVLLAHLDQPSRQSLCDAVTEVLHRHEQVPSSVHTKLKRELMPYKTKLRSLACAPTADAADVGSTTASAGRGSAAAAAVERRRLRMLSDVPLSLVLSVAIPLLVDQWSGLKDCAAAAPNKNKKKKKENLKKVAAAAPIAKPKEVKKATTTE